MPSRKVNLPRAYSDDVSHMGRLLVYRPYQRSNGRSNGRVQHVQRQMDRKASVWIDIIQSHLNKISDAVLSTSRMLEHDPSPLQDALLAGIEVPETDVHKLVMPVARV